MRIVLVVAALAAVLGGCQNQPGRGETFMNKEEVAAKDDAICRGYGAQPGTDIYIQCRMQTAKRRDDFMSDRIGICQSNVVGGTLMTNCY